MTDKKGMNPALAGAIGAAVGVAAGVAAVNLADPKKRSKIKEAAGKVKDSAAKVVKKFEKQT